MTTTRFFLVMAGMVSGASGVTLFQVDDFSADNEGWRRGGASMAPPTMIVGGGPDGSNHLQLTADGAGSDGKLVMWSSSGDWVGDYVAAGVSGISMLGSNESASSMIHLRVAIEGAGGWFVSPAQVLAAGSGWTGLNFSLDAGSMTHVVGSGTAADMGDFSATMDFVTKFEIFSHDGTGPFSEGSAIVRGQDIVADLRLDQITAVPEPGSLFLVGLGMLGLVRRRR